MDDVRAWARRYRDRGFAVCRIRPDEKRPGYRAWNQYSLEPDQFRDGDSIGVQSGRLSDDAVCIDIDSMEALAIADRYLPPTQMSEGRRSKPKSHRWYKVVNIPASLTAKRKVAGGLGGPRTRQFRGQDKKVVVEFRGTGSQAVVPPSVWAKDGRREVREWDGSLGEPAVIDCEELFDATVRLASACGWKPKVVVSSKRGEKSVVTRTATVLPMPTSDVALQARNYVAAIPPSVIGQGGNYHAYYVAAVLVVDFGLSVEDALPVFCAWNRKCAVPWSVEELESKLKAAEEIEGDRGWRAVQRSGEIVVSVRPEDGCVYVGEGCVGDHSFIALPTMRAGLRTVGKSRVLASELAGVDWRGRHVILTPSSCISTNKLDVWSEYFLARLLKREGAGKVECLRLPPLCGRRRTLREAGDVELKTVPPPKDAKEAAARAEEAGRLARELDGERKRLPRNKPSPKLEAACDFVRMHGVTSLTKDILSLANKEGISKDSLRRALGRRNNNTNLSSSYQKEGDSSICHQEIMKGIAA